MGWQLREGGNMIEDRRVADKLTDVGVERAKGLLKFQKMLRVQDGGLNFGAIADNARVREQGCNVFVGIAGHALRIEISESLTIVFPLVEHGFPAQPCLRPFQHKELK